MSLLTLLLSNGALATVHCLDLSLATKKRTGLSTTMYCTTCTLCFAEACTRSTVLGSTISRHSTLTARSLFR